MMLLRLAWRNLVGAGLRTVLNVVVLSITFVAIVGTLGLLEGFNRQTSRALVEGEYGGGQYRHPAYDPLDPISLPDAHGAVPPAVQRQIDARAATAVLVVPWAGKLIELTSGGTTSFTDTPSRYWARRPRFVVSARTK